MVETPDDGAVDGTREEPAADGHEVRVRPAGPLDGAAIASVHLSAIRERGPTAYDDEEVEAWAAGTDPEGYPLDRGRSSTVFLVAVRGAEIVGFGCLERPRREVTAVYVHPDHAGDGVGSALLEALEADAREADLAKLSVTASKNAVPFYRSRGYRRVGPTTHEMADGVALDCVELEKSL